MDQSGFLSLLKFAVQNKVSDVHLQSGSAPAFRLKGDMIAVKAAPLSEDDLTMMLKLMISDVALHPKLATLQDYDCSFEVKGLGRFRVNVHRNRGRLGAVLRIISAKVPTIADLDLPPSLKTIADMHRGLVLVTGATGSGKSSTLAAMIDHLNTTTPMHILTIEDPVEYVHEQKRARITQREIGRDTPSFANALRAALRQDPDVILVGEMRDAETIEIALKAAETGHMVFSTVHTVDAVKTIGRLIAVFPPEEQKMVRLRLSENLTATISQRLVKRDDGKGMVAAQEIMINNTAIAECIANEAMTGNIKDFIVNSYKADGTGGQTFDQHLGALYKKKVLTLETAMACSSNPSDFQRNLMFGNGSSGDSSTSGDNELKKKFDTLEAIKLDRGDDAA